MRSMFAGVWWDATGWSRAIVHVHCWKRSVVALEIVPQKALEAAFMQLWSLQNSFREVVRQVQS